MEIGVMIIVVILTLPIFVHSVNELKKKHSNQKKPYGTLCTHSDYGIELPGFLAINNLTFGQMSFVPGTTITFVLETRDIDFITTMRLLKPLDATTIMGSKTIIVSMRKQLGILWKVSIKYSYETHPHLTTDYYDLSNYIEAIYNLYENHDTAKIFVKFDGGN